MTETTSAAAVPDTKERPAMTVWPTIAATRPGRLVGRLAACRTGLGSFFTVGTLLAVATIPVSLAVYAWQLLPRVCRRYTLTSRRIIVQKGLTAVEETSLPLSDFDTIEVDDTTLPGQKWHRAGELVFLRGDTEVFRLSGVSRPEVFRQVCLKARRAVVSVRKVLEQQAAAEQAVGS